MKKAITILLSIIILSGCSHQGNIAAPDDTYGLTPQIMLPQANRWLWDASLYRVSADHTAIEKLSSRTADWHLNVTPFVEPPNCNDCLMVGKPQIQPDGTIKIKVMLTHPFPGQPQYTGFDVRGTIIFPATRHWMIHLPQYTIYNYMVYWETPAYFSRAEDGGGQLLNADGYTFYLFPGLYLGPEFEQPIFNYSKGQYAYGPDPDSTINGYKLFTNDPERRMFKTTDSINRTYHIDPPDGQFTFGYVVDASWAPATTTPVTDPKNDFPFWANCEDGYVLDSEQIAPFKTGTYPSPENPQYYDVVRMTMTNHPCVELLSGTQALFMFCPDLVPTPEGKSAIIATGQETEKLGAGIYRLTAEIRPGTWEGPPGEYNALLVGQIPYYKWWEDKYPAQLLQPYYYDLIKLEVVD